jgi:hypothetical protein
VKSSGDRRTAHRKRLAKGGYVVRNVCVADANVPSRPDWSALRKTAGRVSRVRGCVGSVDAVLLLWEARLA